MASHSAGQMVADFRQITATTFSVMGCGLRRLVSGRHRSDKQRPQVYRDQAAQQRPAIPAGDIGGDAFGRARSVAPVSMGLVLRASPHPAALRDPVDALRYG